MTANRRVRYYAAETALTLGALLGVASLLLAVGGVAFGVKPMVVRSGSMEPAIDTGALALARGADASEITPGDIVSVVTPQGQRVTHRVVNSSPVEGATHSLTLKGDANPVADPQPYEVKRVDKVFFDVPVLGSVVAFVATPIGTLLLGVTCMVGLMAAWRQRPPRHARVGVAT